MSDTHGQDQFTTVANRRAGYTEPVEWALKIARKGGTLAAGEGLLIVEHYEAQLAKLREQYAMSLEEHGELMRQRQETSSQLWDCMNERDGWKHRAERAERLVEAVAGLAEVDVINGGEYFDDICVQPVLAAYHRYVLDAAGVK